MFLYLRTHREGEELLNLWGITTYCNTMHHSFIQHGFQMERCTVQKRQTHFPNCPCHFITNTDENCSKQWHHLKTLENSYIHRNTADIFGNPLMSCGEQRKEAVLSNYHTYTCSSAENEEWNKEKSDNVRSDGARYINLSFSSTVSPCLFIVALVA